MIRLEAYPYWGYQISVRGIRVLRTGCSSVTKWEFGNLEKGVREFRNGGTTAWEWCYAYRGMALPSIRNRLVILCLDLEVSLRMVADGALLGRFLAYHDMTAVGALPDDIVIL